MSTKGSNQKHTEKKTKVVESKTEKSSAEITKSADKTKNSKSHKGGSEAKTKVEPEPEQVQAPVETTTKSTKSTKSSKSKQVEAEPEQKATTVATKGKKSAVVDTKAEPVQTGSSKTKTKSSKSAKTAEKPAVTQEAAGTKKTKASKIEVVEEAEDEDEVAVKNGLRYFKLDWNGNISGRYSGRKPKQAANKAYSSVVKKEGLQRGGAKIQFSIKECTRGSKQKRYTYDAERIELQKPVEVIINGADGKEKRINYNFNNKLSKAKQVIAQQE
jgi:hypothetical protein